MDLEFVTLSLLLYSLGLVGVFASPTVRQHAPRVVAVLFLVVPWTAVLVVANYTTATECRTTAAAPTPDCVERDESPIAVGGPSHRVTAVRGFPDEDCEIPLWGVGGNLEVWNASHLLLVSGCTSIHLMDATRLRGVEVPSNLREKVGPKGVLKFTSLAGRLLYASYLDGSDESCYRVAVVRADATDAPDRLNFQSFFHTRDCVAGANDVDNLHAVGAKLHATSERVLLTTGDLLLDSSPAQDAASDWGKVLELDASDGRFVRVVSRGHRNPQGLALWREDLFVVTEHGPNGGDEINLVDASTSSVQNFGWPVRSYGNHYNGTHIPSRHTPEYEEPLLYFPVELGSHGVSDVRALNATTGSFAVASLSGGKLYVLRLRGDGHVAYAQRIRIGHRIRSIAVQNECHMVLLTESDLYHLGPMVVVDVCGIGTLFRVPA